MLEDIEPRDDIVLSSGDVLVVLGVANKLNALEKYVLTGK
jgi:Trk K+ transport system NAD-binding subunit